MPDEVQEEPIECPFCGVIPEELKAYKMFYINHEPECVLSRYNVKYLSKRDVKTWNTRFLKYHK